MSGHHNLVDASFREQLVSACRTAVGDSLRSITYFTPDEYEQVYLRSDLEADADLTATVEHEAAGFRTQMAYDQSELGDYQYTLRVFENGFLTRVIVGKHGVFVTTDGITVLRSREVTEAIGAILRETVEAA
ncbi:DUF7522 family protein [Haloplanus aerogenes]|uniref:Uncharacterized protein n=1 Tax=Haloplanus aerogenes TaxID=660522 RepID=A0A3M0EB21_9EURY|nr:hypothetical protein [Haloplanus aerogenes]AZH25516.1 hypothetical protein DU502_09030 [Haloplanus aerogenes]RMB25230.1 hypothetical protein ATH50_0314 [Haloplanus aerogenes]